MENVHVLTRQTDSNGDYLPYGQIYSEQNDISHTHALVTQLQKTLELTKLLNIFSVEASRVVQFAGLQFHSTEGVIEMTGSKIEGENHAFDLMADGERLGQLIYFSQNLPQYAKQKLARLHTALVYPLRNALLFSRVKKLATKDALTGLNNRSMFDDCLYRKLERSRRHHRSFGLMLLDLDNFKQVNDQHGHQVGDQVLIDFANILTDCVRGTDTVFRFGGDEFAILIDDDNFEVSHILANRIKKRVHSHQLLKTHSVTTSIGFSLSKAKDIPNSIFERADRALYAAKQDGRDCCKTN
ncbi:putative diguanylate cyclase AdrA [Pseudoalteromonas sp. P1-9]|uniref:GGDEF domain-containing protein n=1 Tax=Pseudoalteromonas sp. P1-9 TaxID=1710354 RepID=UPI0006D5CF80|nr:GGDEF domain-containing protein [Pseudoalteromonas sp. P1-9]KPV95576.1 putative diguanylate cyclase AdrA [Pseudoalteromonas sp. P1-9]